MMPPTRRTSVRYGSRYGSDADSTAMSRLCPLCQTATLSPRARYCSAACKQRAYRLRQTTVAAVYPATLPADAAGRRARVAHTVYQCPTCEARLLGARRCPDCHLFCRRLGLGGLCPHCDDPVTLAELLGSEEVLPTR